MRDLFFSELKILNEEIRGISDRKKQKREWQALQQQ